jgi:ATP-binding cassette subfamily C protein
MHDWDPEQLADHIGYMPQDCAMLAGSIAENICRFRRSGEIDRVRVDSLIIDAARQAGVHEMILALPGGYDRMLDAQGGGLSAGQRQRIALARALYGEPPILVLDEPNAALDAEGETALARAISKMREKGSCIVIITHRSSILALSDYVLVMAGGRIEKFAPRDSVLNVRPANSQLSNIVSFKEV